MVELNGRLKMKRPRDVSAAKMDHICKRLSGNASNNHTRTSLVRDNGSPLSITNVAQQPVGVPEKNRSCKLLSWYVEGEIVAEAVIY
ncbi:hypothetical protein MKW98_015055 [Papaver atlanticum]|uniref:Uncharacterized protein n=1 Tax=Papaver atlanticum TaxID=357466 RepID=A0AAD4S8I2_9MAGN|nr:hypothetical protein MKW98_015055 [Papaver atlanticum]